MEAQINVCTGECNSFQENPHAKASQKLECGRDLRDHLVQSPHFPDAKESWYSAPLNIKEHFRKHKRILGKANTLS